jgi:transposase
MVEYVGLDVSLKETSVCVVEASGEIVFEGRVTSDPDAIAAVIGEKAGSVARIGLETGPTSTWLWTELHGRGLPVVCIDARHAKAALKMQVNKTDRNDAHGLAQVMRCGWYKEVRVKSLDSHTIRALLNGRALLVKVKRDLENQIRGLLKNQGLIIGKGHGGVFTSRTEELIADRAALGEVARPLLAARAEVCRQIARLGKRVLALARENDHCRRFMSVPGVGPITALAFYAAIEDPRRFRRSRSVGAYFGLTPRRYQSGEVDRAGRISKCGDRLMRTLLFEAAGVLLTRVRKWCALKAWGLRLARRTSFNKAKVAVARKLAVMLHRMWCDETVFQWSTKEATA